MAFNTFQMRTPRALVAADPRRFGRAPAWQLSPVESERWALSDDFKLFASTFTAGFLFVSILIG